MPDPTTPPTQVISDAEVERYAALMPDAVWDGWRTWDKTAVLFARELWRARQEIAALRSSPASPWRPISEAPKGHHDVLDLWCVGHRDDIAFYCPDFCATGRYVAAEGDAESYHEYQGRVTAVQWRDGAWRPKHGLRLHPLTVTPTHWKRVPAPPVPAEGDR